MTKTSEIEDELQSLFQEELSDPNPNRSNQDWVFTEKPKTTTRYPYIIISLLDVQKSGYSVGSTDREHLHRIQASIRMKENTEYVINGEDKGSGFVKWFLSEEMDSLVQNNQDRFRDLGDDIFNILPDSGNPVSPGNTKQVSNDYILYRRRG